MKQQFMMKQSLVAIAFWAVLLLAVQMRAEPTKYPAHWRPVLVDQKVYWAGVGEPSTNDVAELNSLIRLVYDSKLPAGIDIIEQYVSSKPTGGWAPALKNFLADYYLQHAQFTRSLGLWESVWAETKQYKGDEEGKRVADASLANWTRLLASLGRYDILTGLVKETEGRLLDGGPLTQKFIRTKEAYADMRLHPEISYRCGTLAMMNVCHELYGTNFDFMGLNKIESPTNGFTLRELEVISQKLKLELVPVKLQPSAPLIVPSVVNWNQHHYGAIISVENGLYTLVDPTMGMIRTHLTENEIKSEASGYYMIAANQVNSSCAPVPSSAALTVFGKGNPYLMKDINDQPTFCPAPLGSGPGNQGPGNGQPGMPCLSCAAGPVLAGNSGVSGAMGMPQWGVSEPYINLWLQDEPLAYQPAYGPDVAFKLYYRDRVENSYLDGALGLNWSCEWFQHFERFGLNLLLPGGGNTSFGNLGVRNYYNHYQLAALATNSDSIICFAEIDLPDGRKNIYNVLTNLAGDATTYLYLTQQIDAQSNSLHFYYTNFFPDSPYNPPSLANVVDATGLTNTLSYIEDLYGNAYVTSVTDPYQRSVTIQYNTNTRPYVITNLTDPVGIHSTMVYDNNGWPTNLITPYGGTTFTKLDVTSNDTIVRGVLAKDPQGGQTLYYFDQDSAWITYPNAAIPTNTPIGTLDTNNTDWKNSYVWGPRQFQLLSPTFQTSLDFTLLTTNDFVRSRIRHWLGLYLFTESHDVFSVDTLSLEQEPSPNGTAFGPITWYDYPGKTAPSISGTEILPGVSARVLPDGSTSYEWYQRDAWGHVTQQVSEWFENGQAQLRTNTYVYDSNGFDILKTIGPDGVANWSYGYDAHHRMLAATNALGEFTKYTYNGNEQLISITEPNGLITTNIYGGDHFLSQQIMSGVLTNTYSYANALMLTHTDPRGLTVTITWDSLNRLTGTAFPDGTYTSNQYALLDITGVRDRMGYWTHYGYDGMRRKTAETNALNNYTLYQYCSCGALDSVQDFGGNSTHYYYDDAGRLTNTLYVDGYAIARTYDSLGRVVSVLDGGSRFTNTFNGHDMLVAVTNSAGMLSRKVYDVNNLVTNEIDVNGVSINMTYDGLHRLTSRKYPDSGTERFVYTLNIDGMTSYTNQLNSVWTYAYDLLGRKTNEIAVSVYTNAFVYGPAGDLLTLTDGKTQNTTWKYDVFGHVTNKLDNLGTNLFVYSYDADNRLTNRNSAAKGLTKYSYDAVGNLTFIDYPASSDITLQYDVMNRLTNMLDAVGTTRYSYDAAGQILSEDGPWDNDTVSYTYASRLRNGFSVAAPNASPWMQSYGYDQARRLTNVTSFAGSFTYLLGGASPASSLVKKLLLPSGAYITNYYDGNARLLGTYLRNSSNANLDTEDYVYNLGSQRTQQVFIAGNFMNYTYDSIGELKTARGKESGGVTNRMQEQFGYVYDAAGNLNFRTNNTLLAQFNVNSLNELTVVTNGGKLTVAGATTSRATSVTVNSTSAIMYGDTSFASTNQSWANGNNTYTAVGNDSYGRQDTDVETVNLQQTNTYAYDLNGNMVTNGTRVLDYGDENQLIRISEPNAWKSEFTYDGKLRRRIRKEYTWTGSSWVQTNEVRYVYDGNLVIQERDGNNLPQVSYSRGIDLGGAFESAGGIGGLLARTDMGLWNLGLGLAHAFYHADGNGNITALTYMNQQLAARYEYDPYGRVLTQSGPLADTNPYRFSSKEYHSASGLLYYLYRYYDVNLQRWPNQDPITEVGWNVLTHHLPSKLAIFKFADKNPYEFSMNDALDRYDPLGLDSITFWILGCLKSSEGKKDPAACFCIIAPDESDCKKQMSGCLTAAAKCIPDPETGKPGKPSKKEICNCGCDVLGTSNAITPSALKDCHDRCDKLK